MAPIPIRPGTRVEVDLGHGGHPAVVLAATDKHAWVFIGTTKTPKFLSTAKCVVAKEGSPAYRGLRLTDVTNFFQHPDKVQLVSVSKLKVVQSFCPDGFLRQLRELAEPIIVEAQKELAAAEAKKKEAALAAVPAVTATPQTAQVSTLAPNVATAEPAASAAPEPTLAAPSEGEPLANVGTAKP